MTRTNIILKKFETPLGNITCGLSSDSNNLNFVEHKIYENGKSEVFETTGHRIEVIEFKIWQPLYNGGTITDSLGWVWKVKKINNQSESLETFCLFENSAIEVNFDSACGEALDAIEVYNEVWSLYIGTEDGEALNSRAKNEDEFPSRLENKVDFYNSITLIQQNGAISKIPKLVKDEILHLQYLTAYDKINEETLNPWFAVDQDKRKLENWIGIPW